MGGEGKIGPLNLPAGRQVPRRGGDLKCSYHRIEVFIKIVDLAPSFREGGGWACRFGSLSFGDEGVEA